MTTLHCASLLLLLNSASFAADAHFMEAETSPLRLPGGGHSIVAGDVDNDGNVDLLVCGKNQLHVLIGNGRGGFAPGRNSPLRIPFGASETVLTDCNGDSALDWAGAHHDHYEVIVLLGKGDGNFSPAPNSPVPARMGTRPHTHGLVAADVNGDRHSDFLTANNEDNDIAVLLGDGKGGFTPAPESPFPVEKSPYPFAVGDVNGDGNPDVVTPSSGPGLRTISVLLGDGRGSFRRAEKPPALEGVAPWFVALADVNGDGLKDILTTHNEADGVSVFLGAKEGPFPPAASSPFKLGQHAWGLVAADIDNDGAIDLAAAGQSSVSILMGDGRGSFRRSSSSPVRAGKGAWRLCVADFNNDKQLDIATGNVESDDVTILLQKEKRR